MDKDSEDGQQAPPGNTSPAPTSRVTTPITTPTHMDTDSSFEIDVEVEKEKGKSKWDTEEEEPTTKEVKGVVEPEEDGSAPSSPLSCPPTPESVPSGLRTPPPSTSTGRGKARWVTSWSRNRTLPPVCPQSQAKVAILGLLETGQSRQSRGSLSNLPGRHREQEHDGLLPPQVLFHLPAGVEQGEGRMSSVQGKVLHHPLQLQVSPQPRAACPLP